MEADNAMLLAGIRGSVEDQSSTWPLSVYRAMLKSAQKEPKMKMEKVSSGVVDVNMKQVPSLANMTLRDHFAGLAMQSIMLLPKVFPSRSPQLITALAYEQADSMIAERDKLYRLPEVKE